MLSRMAILGVALLAAVTAALGAPSPPPKIYSGVILTKSRWVHVTFLNPYESP